MEKLFVAAVITAALILAKHYNLFGEYFGCYVAYTIVLYATYLAGVI